ncbi:MAG: serine/threonine protein kinase [Oceanicaulis sp.]|uniref:serine/threonine-protein kinase n=1 Tax=Glycocaulis sp. TaxID=1969725 RepID=UPI0025BB37E2|nr:serine/threonine-protein kinase [Glycocaulis sp.]MCC5981779.1 serine/threonine protein kinase [Oceanicaulis sp.]MCH8522897.1 serine/threonine-protein kinase [Glycocaulis sp.]
MEHSRPSWTDTEALLDAALEMPQHERPAFVAEKAASAELASEVMALLEAAEHSASFLEPDPADQEDADGVADNGTRFGAWRVAGLIAQGGMGQVYRAERADGLYEQTGALKLMKPLSPDHIEWFERERRVLARLDHPGIARLLDGGVSNCGRPWMVMEFAAGAPFDQWARQNRPSLRACLELFLQVCDALADAHAKLIVHRDVKPSNILVDESGRAKVIDFGVANLSSSDTGQGPPLSLDFAAPELLEGGPASTASDVYGLAATLYTVLARRTPLQLSELPVQIAARHAVENEPPLLRTVAAPPLTGALASDLEAVLAKALRKKADDRYQTVEAFAQDVRNLLEIRPVTARREERGYVLRRSLLRYRWQTAAAAALVLSLSAGFGASAWQAGQTRIERDWALDEQARLEAVQHYLYFMLRDGADASGGTSASASSILEAAADQVSELFSNDPVRGGPVMHALGELYFYLNDYNAAEPILNRLVDSGAASDPAVLARAKYDLAQVRLRTGDREHAAALLAEAQSFWAQDRMRWNRRLVDSRLLEARILRDTGRLGDGIALLQANLPSQIRLGGANDRRTGVYHNDLAVMLHAAGRFEEAAISLEQAMTIWQSLGLENSPDALNSLNNLAAVRVMTGDRAGAAPLFREIIDIRRSLYGPSAATAAVLNNYGKTLTEIGEAERAVAYLEEAVAMATEHAGPGSLLYASSKAGLADALAASGRPDEGLLAARRGYETALANAGSDSPATALVGISLARELARTGDVLRASALLDDSEAVFIAMGPGGAAPLQLVQNVRAQFLPEPSEQSRR